jgi:hypothetical protein
MSVSEAVKKPVPEPINQASSRAAFPPERVPGNYYSFDFLIEIAIDGMTHVGRPCNLLRLGGTPPVTRWASEIKYFLSDPKITRVPWVDDPQKGLLRRTLTVPEDLLGAEGMIADKKCFFEQILDAGKNLVVFSIYCNQQQFHIAYGFSRDLFKKKSPAG